MGSCREDTLFFFFLLRPYSFQMEQIDRYMSGHKQNPGLFANSLEMRPPGVIPQRASGKKLILLEDSDLSFLLKKKKFQLTYYFYTSYFLHFPSPSPTQPSP